MCELLGISFNQPVNSRVSFKGFIRRGDSNPHGWGVAYYPSDDYSAQIIKEPVMAGSSSHARFLNSEVNVRSKIFISHVRYSSVGERIHSNTHPFCRAYNGRNIVFVHNGTLHGYKTALASSTYTPIGETDSEYAFCYFLQEASQSSGFTSDNFSHIESILKEINNYGNFNCLFSDGEYLFCYRDKNGYNGLCYVKREPPYSEISLADEDYTIDLGAKKDPSEQGYIIASKPLTSEEWIDLPTGALTVFKGNEIVYPIKKKLTETELRILRYLRNQPHKESLFVIANNASFKINELSHMKHLVSLGYIRQDRSESKEPFPPFATYYTVPNERELIDKLLKQDMQKHILPLDLATCRQAGADDKIPYCFSCKQAYRTGTTYCRKCLRNLESFDVQMLDIITELNNKGFETSYCCSGHGRGDIYIDFKDRELSITTPNGFRVTNTHGSNVLRSIPCHMVLGKKRNQIEDFEVFEMWEQNMATLRDWVQKLSTRATIGH